MKVSLKAGLLAVGVLAASSIVAYSAGYFPGFPIVGSAAYCQGVSSYSTSVTNPGTTQTPTSCNDNVAAGPTIVTGNELIPADTGLGNQVPATVLLTMASLNALPPAYPQFSNATNPNTFTVSPNVGSVYLSATVGSLSSVQMQMPANPIDGQHLNLSSANNIATILISPNTGQTIGVDAKVTALTVTLTGSYGYTFLWQAATSTWHRLQ